MQKNEVLASFDELLREQLPNILIGLRLVENVACFPEPIEEELKLQWVLNFQGQDFSYNKAQYKKWLLLKGFEDIHKTISKCLRQTLVYERIKREGSISEQNIEKIRKLSYPDLIDKVQTACGKIFSHKKELDSFNLVRNALIHDNGVISETRLKSGEDKLILYGAYPILFFQDGDRRVPMEIGKPGPAGAGLMMGAEKFQIAFSVGEVITFSLKEFVNIVSTCIFIRADIGVMLEAVDSAHNKTSNLNNVEQKGYKHGLEKIYNSSYNTQ